MDIQFTMQPDITAPGVSILAAIVPKSEADSGLIGKKSSDYAMRSGTSMACPHVAGAAAFIKSIHHDWSSSMIKSALMTTGCFLNPEFYIHFCKLPSLD